jgi:hypothetical protein
LAGEIFFELPSPPHNSYKTGPEPQYRFVSYIYFGTGLKSESPTNVAQSTLENDEIAIFGQQAKDKDPHNFPLLIHGITRVEDVTEFEMDLHETTFMLIHTC